MKTDDQTVSLVEFLAQLRLLVAVVRCPSAISFRSSWNAALALN